MSRGFNTSMLDAVAALGTAATSPSSRHSGWSDSEDDSDDGGPPEPVPTPARRASRPPARPRTASRPAIDMARRQDMLDAAFPLRRRRPSATPAAPRRASAAPPPTAVREAAPPPRAKPPPPPPPKRKPPPPPPPKKEEDWEHSLREPIRSKPPPPPPRSPIASLSELENELAALKRDLQAQTARNAELEKRNAARERDADMLRADLADAEAERTRALRLVVGVLGRDRVERALANGGIGSLLRDGRTAYRPMGSMGPPSDAGRRSRSDEMYHVTSW